MNLGRLVSQGTAAKVGAVLPTLQAINISDRFAVQRKTESKQKPARELVNSNISSGSTQRLGFPVATSREAAWNGRDTVDN